MFKRKKYLRKNFLLPFVFWILFLLFIFLFPPEPEIMEIPFYLFLLLAVFYSFKLIFYNGEALVWSLGIATILLLRQYELLNYLNLSLISGILLIIEIYFRKR